jgi:hypothetical protein
MIMSLGIEDISVKSDLNKVLSKVEEKFRLDLTGNHLLFLMPLSTHSHGVFLLA